MGFSPDGPSRWSQQLSPSGLHFDNCSHCESWAECIFPGTGDGTGGKKSPIAQIWLVGKQVTSSWWPPATDSHQIRDAVVLLFTALLSDSCCIECLLEGWTCSHEVTLRMEVRTDSADQKIEVPWPSTITSPRPPQILTQKKFYLV